MDVGEQMDVEYEGAAGLRRFRRDFAGWLDENGGTLDPQVLGAPLDDAVARTRSNQRRLWDAGWLRWGWPAAVGGLGGSPTLRAAAAEEAVARQLFLFPVFAVGEVMIPAVVQFAPDLAARYASGFLDGTEPWCQGFSEPNSGSDLASLRCRAVDAGDHWVVSGQKIWTSYAQFATRIVVLTRTGSVESRHRGITALLIDLDAPGLTVRPLHAMNDEDEFSEVFLDEVTVTKDRVIGEIDGGWTVAMTMLGSERGGIFWMLSRLLLERYTDIIADHVPDDLTAGRVYASIAGLRARTWLSQHRGAAGTMTTPESSIDKVLMATAEQELFDFTRLAMGARLELGDSPADRARRAGYIYSRAASIYGGTAEIQRNIVAAQLLGLRGAR